MTNTVLNLLSRTKHSYIDLVRPNASNYWNGERKTSVVSKKQLKLRKNMFRYQ